MPAAELNPAQPGTASPASGASDLRPYERTVATLEILRGNPHDDATRLLAARLYLHLGLGLPAREVLDAGGEDFLCEPAIRSLRDHAAGHSGRQTWGRRAARFEANLRALGSRGIDTRIIRTNWALARERCQLFTDRSGVDHVRVCDTEEWRWWPRLADHPAVAAAAQPPEDHQLLMPGPYAFDGIELGWFFERVWRSSRNTFLGYSSGLYVIAREPAALAIALHLHDWAGLLADPAVMLFVGDDAAERLRDALSNDPDLPLPKYLFRGAALATVDTGLGSTAADASATLMQANEQRTRRTAASLSQIETQYLGRNAGHWAKRFGEALGGGPPMRILATVSTHTSFLQYSMRDALRALQQLGCQTRLITESRPFEMIGAETYHRHVAEFNPDLFFAIDHLRTSFGGKLPAGLPMMTWDQDALPHLMNETNVRKMGPLDTVVGLSQAELIGRGGCDPEAFLTSQMAASPEQFDASGLTDADLTPYRCDVSYVSHASQTGEQFHAGERAAFVDEGARRLLDTIYPLAIAHVQHGGTIHGGMMRGVLEQAERRAGVQVVDPAIRHRILNWYIWRLCDRVFRHQALEWVAEWARRAGRSFRIYGNGWDKHPTLAPFAARPAQNGRELLCVYRASAINLQLMPAGFLHQRALDGVLAGGFFLARETAADRRDPRLPRLWTAVTRRQIRSAAELRTCGDPALVRRFDAVRRSVGHREDEAERTFQFLRSDAQWDYPAEVVADFGQIVFRDAASLAALADRFLAAPPRRRQIAERMRGTVLERYSYRALMQKFLQFAARFLARKAGS